jgi:hypothetical protein
LKNVFLKEKRKLKSFLPYSKQDINADDHGIAYITQNQTGVQAIQTLYVRLPKME